MEIKFNFEIKQDFFCDIGEEIFEIISKLEKTMNDRNVNKGCYIKKCYDDNEIKETDDNELHLTISIELETTKSKIDH